MNRSKFNSPLRLICRLARMGERTDPGKTPSWRDRHIDACAECAAFFDATEAMEAELRNFAPTAPTVVPDGLEDRIWAAVKDDQTTGIRPARRQSGVGGGRPGFVLAGVALVAGFFVWSSTSSGPDSPEITQADFSQQDMQVLVTQIGNLSAEWFGAQSNTQVDLQASRLAEELNALESDASAALRFLERSFLPIRRSAS